MIKVKLTKFNDGSYIQEDLEVEKLLASSKEFPYWTFWYSEDQAGYTRVRFISASDVIEVDLQGEPEEEKEEKLAQIIPFNREHDDILEGGDTLGTVPQD